MGRIGRGSWGSKKRRSWGVRCQRRGNNCVERRGCLARRISRLRGEAETPTSNQSPCSTKATSCWGPWRSTLVLWLRLEAKPERALGQGATVGVLGTGVPRLACLRPTAWLCAWARTAHLHQQAFKTLTRGQASRGGRHKTSSGEASPGRPARGGEIKARQTSRGYNDVSHDDRDQAGDRLTVSLFHLWC